MSGIASHLPRFEDASRALFAGDASAFDACIAACIAAWPGGVPAHLRRLARDAFGELTSLRLMTSASPSVTRPAGA